MSVHKVSSDAEWREILEAAKESQRVLVVDFTASWCGPCKVMSPVFEMLAQEYEDLVCAKIDVDEMEELAAELGISAMPTFQAWINEEKADQFVGASRERLKEFMEKYNAMQGGI